MTIYIDKCAYYVPEQIVTNEQIIKANSLRIKDSWIEKRIGITERRWAPAELAASDLAHEAVKKLNLKNFAGPIFFSTISPDYMTPSTSSILKKKMGQTDHFPTFDLNGACAGQIFALDMAKNRLLANPNENEALVVASEVRSRYLDKKDRRTVFLFGDGASVFHLKKESGVGKELEWVESRTLAYDEETILVPGGGSKFPTLEFGEEHPPTIKMNDGEKIFHHATESLSSLVKEMLDEKSLTVDDFSFFAFHQGNGAIIKQVCENCGISLDKTWSNFFKFGNTSGASMGIALAEAIELGKVKQGDRVLMMAMGAGYHVAMASSII